MGSIEIGAERIDRLPLLEAVIMGERVGADFLARVVVDSPDQGPPVMVWIASLVPPDPIEVVVGR